MPTPKTVRGLLCVAAAALLSACGPPPVVKVTEREYGLTLDRGAVPPGDVTFTVTNAGLVPHGLIIFKTELPADGLPVVTQDNTTVIDESSPELERLQPEVDTLLGGGTRSITVRLTPGQYAVVCNDPDHYRNGMYAALSAK